MRAVEEQSAGEVSRDTVFTVLSNRRRRLVLRRLRDEEPAVEIRDLATRVAAWENDTPPEELSYRQRKRVYTSLHQTHLPKLDEAGFVTYDRNRGTVTYEPPAAVLEPYLDADPERPTRPRAWYRYYLAVGAVAVAVAALAALGVPPFVAVPGHWWAVSVGLAVVVVAVADAATGGGGDGDAR